jgi:acyl-homoserine lactone acylase PvdQ
MRLQRDQREREGRLYLQWEDIAAVAARRAHQAERALEGASKYLKMDIAKHMNERITHEMSDFVYHAIMQAASDHYREKGAEGLLTVELPAEWLRMMDRDSLQKRVFDYYVQRYVRNATARFMVPDFGQGESVMEDTIFVVEIDIPSARYRQHMSSVELESAERAASR